MSKPALKLSNICKSHGKKVVLENLDITINQGETVGLVGINGAGKTTLLKCILDLNRVDSGDVSIFGKSHLLATSRSSLAYLPERFAAPPHLNGNDYIKFMLRLQNKSYSQIDIDTASQSLDLSKTALSMSVSSFSKGMMQKLGLICCFLSTKDLFILDEPMSGLDPLARMFLKNRLEELKVAGHTLLICTHMLADVASVCDRMLVLHNNTIQFDGSLKEFTSQFGEDDLDSSFVACIAQNS